MRQSWTFPELLFFFMEYPICDNPRELASFLKKPYTAIKSKAKFYKLKRQKHTGFSTCTPKQEQYIVKNYLTLSINQLALNIGRSDTLIRGVLRRRGLVVPKKIIQQRLREVRFKKGHIPANKGRDFYEYASPETIKKISKGWFKKGHMPKNGEGFKVGDITDRQTKNENRKMKYIRLGKGRWYPLHQYNWQKKNGPVPKGHCLWFKDGDWRNCKVGNLELITRQENMRRNSCSVRLTDGYVATTLARKKGRPGHTDNDMYKKVLANKELIAAQRARLLLNRTIKKLEHENSK